MAATASIVESAEQRLTVEAHDHRAWPRIASAWSELSSATPHQCFFLTPESVEAWLAAFGSQLNPSLLLFRSDGDVVAACIVVRRTERKGPFFVRRVYLNTAGEYEGDSPCIEYNTLLCKPGFEMGTASALREHLDEQPWDELDAPGMLEGPALLALHTAFANARPIDVAKPSFFVDLGDVRKSGKDFVEKLASRERTRYRQQVRKYSELGDITVSEAQSTEDALRYLDALAVLHQKRWISRGKPGSFASAPFCAYHRELIERCFPQGTIQLLHVCAGSTTIGYHYNFVFDGRVYFYQCGYDYELGEKLSPGVIVHTFAIRHAAGLGLVDYEFMAGDVEYKRRLSTSARQMHWMVWQAPTLKMRSFELARQAKRTLHVRLGEMRSSLRGAVLPAREKE